MAEKIIGYNYTENQQDKIILKNRIVNNANLTIFFIFAQKFNWNAQIIAIIRVFCSVEFHVCWQPTTVRRVGCHHQLAGTIHPVERKEDLPVEKQAA